MQNVQLRTGLAPRGHERVCGVTSVPSPDPVVMNKATMGQRRANVQPSAQKCSRRRYEQLLSLVRGRGCLGFLPLRPQQLRVHVSIHALVGPGLRRQTSQRLEAGSVNRVVWLDALSP